jgi:nucleoside-diphosphate-sugar epimerase
VSLNQLVAEIGTVLGRPVTVEHGAARAFDVPANVLDASLALRHLGWSASTPLGAGLQRTCDWLRSAH